MMNCVPPSSKHFDIKESPEIFGWTSKDFSWLIDFKLDSKMPTNFAFCNIANFSSEANEDSAESVLCM